MTTRPLPPYTHIPGVTPHPLRDPAGHSYQAAPTENDIQPVPPLTWASLLAHDEYHWAKTLFNAGYYWEAHEAWESLWHAAGRTGPLADYLKGLIKLAAAGVKLREHNLAGVERHARRARELFQAVANQPATTGASRQLLSLRELMEIASQLAQRPPALPTDRSGQAVAVLPQLR